MTGDCPTCGESVYFRPHVCPPIFTVWCPENGQIESDAEAIRAYRPETAAQKWAERSDCNSAEYSIVRGSDATVFVKKEDTTEIRVFVVSGESVPEYRAMEKK